MKLFVAGISGDFDETDLKDMFGLYGEVRFAQIIKDRATGKSKGFGFVEMPNDNEAKEAMDLLDGASLFGKKIAVKLAEDQPRNAPSPSPKRWNNNNNDNSYRRRS